MKYLYLDTSSNYLYTAITTDDEVLCEVKSHLDGNLSTHTVNEISKMFDSIKITPQDIDKIIVVNGPGSFTGIRIGVTIAKTYAWTLKKEIIAISSLEAMAISGNDNKYKIPLIDARRDYSYAGVFNEKNEEVFNQQYVSNNIVKAFVNTLPVEYEYISNDQYDDFNIVAYDPNILKIINFVKNKPSVNPHAIVPNYLKKTEAEEKLNDQRSN